MARTKLTPAQINTGAQNASVLTQEATASTTFKMKYSASGGTATFKSRRIAVIPL